MRRVLLLLLLVACGDPGTLPESEGPLTVDQREAADLPIEGRLLEPLATDASGRRAVAVVEADAFGSRLVALERGDAGWQARALVDRGTPSRAAIAPDGTEVIFVWGGQGMAGLWRVPFDGGEPERLTNGGPFPKEARGGPPPGFVPLPLDPPDFDGTTARWVSEDGEHALEVGR